MAVVRTPSDRDLPSLAAHPWQDYGARLRFRIESRDIKKGRPRGCMELDLKC